MPSRTSASETRDVELPARFDVRASAGPAVEAAGPVRARYCRCRPPHAPVAYRDDRVCAGHARGGATLAAGRPALLSGCPAVLALAPFVAGVALGPPWFRVDPALRSALHVGRILPVLLVSAAYLTSTPVRDTRAAVQRLMPGNPARFSALGWRSSSDCSRWCSLTFARCATRSTPVVARLARYGTALGCSPSGRSNGRSTARTGSRSPSARAVSRGTRRSADWLRPARRPGARRRHRAGGVAAHSEVAGRHSLTRRYRHR